MGKGLAFYARLGSLDFIIVTLLQALEAGGLGSNPSSAAYQLWDLGQVISSLCVSVFSYAKWESQQTLEHG